MAMTTMKFIGDRLAVMLLGMCVGHPHINGSGAELEELDNVYDDAVYCYDWLPWGWRPGLCTNCLFDFSKRPAIPVDDTYECPDCCCLQIRMGQ